MELSTRQAASLHPAQDGVPTVLALLMMMRAA
jgi:hypothetical protein